jgi:hypothetical protein
MSKDRNEAGRKLSDHERLLTLVHNGDEMIDEVLQNLQRHRLFDLTTVIP